MFKSEITKRITDCGVMAIVRADAERAGDIAKACLAGGVKIMEISYSIPSASNTITKLRKVYPDKMVIGAGTVLDSETARIAILAGAQFIIAPTFEKGVAKICNKYQIPYAPGCTTVTEMVTAMEYGATFVKLFPISNFYGPKSIKVIKTPIPQMPILASGGVTLENAAEWIKSGANCLGVGGLLTNVGDDEIESNARELVEIVNEAQNDQ